MFEFEGQQYSLEEITLAAKESKLSVSDYLKKHNIKKLEETVEPVEKLKDVAASIREYGIRVGRYFFGISRA